MDMLAIRPRFDRDSTRFGQRLRDSGFWRRFWHGFRVGQPAFGVLLPRKNLAGLLDCLWGPLDAPWDPPGVLLAPPNIKLGY